MRNNPAILDQLTRWATFIDTHPANWWRFPTENAEKPVQGFMGTGDIMIVGDQPSTSEWDEHHPHRRLFYDTLLRVGAADAHITDLYKKRGPPGEFAKAILKGREPPVDLDEHLGFFRSELALIRPARVVAIGWDAYELLRTLVPETQAELRYLTHFAAIVWCKKSDRAVWRHVYERNMREAFGMATG